MNEEKLSEEMYQATKKIYKAVEGLPTIIIVGMLDAIKTDFLLNYHVKQDGLISPVRGKTTNTNKEGVKQ